MIVKVMSVMIEVLTTNAVVNIIASRKEFDWQNNSEQWYWTILRWNYYKLIYRTNLPMTIMAIWRGNVTRHKITMAVITIKENKAIHQRVKLKDCGCRRESFNRFSEFTDKIHDTLNSTLKHALKIPTEKVEERKSHSRLRLVLDKKTRNKIL